MRKSVAILLLVIYIISSSGVAIKAHYCCGKLKSINLVLDSSSEKTCSNTSKVKASKDCCKDKIATNTTVTDHKATSVVISGNSFKDVLNCVTIVSHGFFQAYDDADSTPACIPSPTALLNAHQTIRVLRL